MKTVLDYKLEHKVLGSLWLRRNPDVFVQSTDDFLKKKGWAETLDLVCHYKKAVVLADFTFDNKKQNISMGHILFPIDFLQMYFQAHADSGFKNLEKIHECSASDLKLNFQEQTQKIMNSDFLRVNDVQKKESFIMADAGFSAFASLERYGSLKLGPVSEGTLRLEDL